MTRLTSLLVPLLAFSVGVLDAPQADAARTAKPTKRRAAKPKPAKRQAARPKARAGAKKLSAKVKTTAANNKAFTSAVSRKTKEMKAWVWDQAMASYTDVVFHPSVKHKTVRQDSYGAGSNQSKAVSLTSGVSKSGVVELAVLNNVSAHDIYHDGMSDSAYKTAVNRRIGADRVRVSVRFPDGTTKVLKSGVKSKDVTVVKVKVKLQKGDNVILVDRMDAHGNVVGSANALAGRGVEVRWNGK